MAASGSGECPVLATPQIGIITSQNANSLVLSSYERTSGTKVKVTCYWEEVYEIDGADEVTCVDGRWVPDPPSCLRKDRVRQTDNSTSAPDTSSSGTDDYTTVIVLVSVACGVLLLVLLAVLLYRACWISRVKHKRKEDDQDSLFSSNTVTKNGTKNLNYVSAGLYNPAWAGSPSDNDPMTQPPSLWSVPSPRRNDLLLYHLYKQPTFPEQGVGTSEAPTVHTRRPAPVSIQATWRGLSTSTREWTYISVDQLLRDIEMSRMTNPNHSWMDFASLSSRPSKKQRL